MHLYEWVSPATGTSCRWHSLDGGTVFERTKLRYIRCSRMTWALSAGSGRVNQAGKGDPGIRYGATDLVVRHRGSVAFLHPCCRFCGGRHGVSRREQEQILDQL
jgi:hypothetical protein